MTQIPIDIIKIEEYTGVYPTFSPNPAITSYEYDVLGNLTRVTDAKNNQTNITYDTLSRKTSMTDPDMGYWEYQYDANGNLASQKDAKNQTILFTYDALNRITKKDYPAGTDIIYAYDETFSTYPKGRLTTVTDSSGTEKFYYDKLGRTIKTIKTVDSVNYTTQTAYDALGRTDTIIYPENTTIKYEYDTGGNLYRVKNNSGGFVYATYSNYNAVGQTGSIGYGNGVNTAYQYYTSNNRLYSITTSKQTTGFINLSYAYDSVGNITNITDYLDSTKTRTYRYDDLNRLIQAGSTSYGGNLVYQYDKIGNMTYNCKYGNYEYDPDHPHAVKRVVKNGAIIDEYDYDTNGNMISGAGRTFTYDYDNRPTSIIYGSTYANSVYDASGNRVKKVTPTSTTIYIGQLYECTSGQCTKYIFAGTQRVAKIESANTYYYHTDHLGSSNIITDSSGSKVEDIYYYPYGEIKTDSGTLNVRHKFTDQEWDAETGLYYYGARYYDPKLARFISADTIVPDFSDPQTLNRYSYTRNNPLRYVDPTGKFWEELIAVVVIAVGSWLTDAAGGNVSVGGGVSVNSGGTMNYSSWNPTTGQTYSANPGSVVGNGSNSYTTSLELYFSGTCVGCSNSYGYGNYGAEEIGGRSSNTVYDSGSGNNLNFSPEVTKNIDILQRTIYGEMRSTPEAYIYGGWVMKNRAMQWFGGNYERAKYGQKGNVSGGFQVWDPEGKNYPKMMNPPLNIPAENRAWNEAGNAALTVYFSPIDPTFGATRMYHVSPPLKGPGNVGSFFTTIPDRNGPGGWIFYK